MDGKELYNLHREITKAFSKEEMVPWEELSPQERQDWEMAAVEQGERDMYEEVI